MSNLLADSLARSLEFLLPGVVILQSQVRTSDFIRRYRAMATAVAQDTGQVVRANKATLWFTPDPGLRRVFTISRIGADLTRFERDVLGYFSHSMRTLLAPTLALGAGQAGVVAGGAAFGQLLVAHFLKAKKFNAGIWTRVLPIVLLQELSRERYEGASCTSGFVMATKPERFLSKVPTSSWTFSQFGSPLALTPEFFGKPTAYRYVDGRNQFYLIDRGGRALGILTIVEPNLFTLADRVQTHTFGLSLEISERESGLRMSAGMTM